MLTTSDFAQRVWVSLEDIRERMAVLETEVKYARSQLERVETDLHEHTSGHKHGGPAPHHDNEDDSRNGASITIKINRRVLGGGGLVGGGIAGLAAATAKALGWW